MCLVVSAAHELQLILRDHKHDTLLCIWEVKSNSGLFWNHTSSTLGHCSLIPSDDWLTTRWVDQEKNKHCHRLCHSVPACRLPTVHFWLWSETLFQPFSPSTSPLPFSAQPWGPLWSPLSWWSSAWWWRMQTWSPRGISTCRG